MSKSRSEAQSVQGVVENIEERIAAASEIFLSDACSSAPNARATEFIIAAKYASTFSVPIRTSIYESDRIGRVITNTPFDLFIPVGASLGAYDTVVYGSRTLTLSPTLISQNYSSFFGDPLQRIQNFYERAIKKAAERAMKTGETEQQALMALSNAAYDKAKRYTEALPATIFSLASDPTVSYVQTLLHDRDNIVRLLTANYYGEELSVGVERGSEILAHITLRDIGASYETLDVNLSKRVALSCVCPECSIASTDRDEEHGDNFIRHAVSFDGRFFRNMGTLVAGIDAKLQCAPMRHFSDYLERNGLSILDIPIGELIRAGFKPSGKLLYIADAMLYGREGRAQGVRAYSDPRGTIEMIFKLWKGFSYLTPSIYVTVQENDPMRLRDATGYELLHFISTGGGEVVERFMKNIPLLDTGMSYTLDLTTSTISVSSMQ